MRGLLFIALLLLCAPARADEPSFIVRSGPRFQVSALDTQTGLADATLERSEKALAEVAGRLGLTPSSRPIRVFLTPSDSLFQKVYRRYSGAEAPGWTLAVAFPSERVIIIRSHATRALTSNDFQLTYRHELAHVLLGEVLGGRRELPSWLHEGLAMWGSGQRLTATESLNLANAARSGSLPKLGAIEKAFPPHAPSAERAYLQSLSFIAWIEERGGREDGEETRKEGGAAELVAHLSEGAPLDAALFRVVKVVDPELEWRYRLRDQASLVRGFLHSWSLWQGAALLAILAIIRHVYKSRQTRMRLALEDDEEPEYGDFE